MSDQDFSQRPGPVEGESEAVQAPQADDAPPQRGRSAFVWVAAPLVLALAVAALLVALGIGALS